jgi:hypothetical protein
MFVFCAEETEAVRDSYRPEEITTLFVGESAPNSGKFFYQGNTQAKQYMAKALTAAGLYDGAGDFFQVFKSYGWYLDDLVLSPVDKLPKTERRKRCLEAQMSLSERIAKYRPRAIVSLMLGIQEIVEASAVAASSSASLFAGPFPGNGQQKKFAAEIARIIPQLPRQLRTTTKGGFIRVRR